MENSENQLTAMCRYCKKLLLFFSFSEGRIEIKCNRCKKINVIKRSGGSTDVADK